MSGDSPTSIWQRPLRSVTVASFAIVFLSAFESLAVTTAMPVVADELGGIEWYSLAFAAPLAAGVIGMVATGALTDRRGPVLPLISSIGFFVVGLAVAAAATSMPMVVLARLFQGLGGGGATVALFVLIARIYPPELRAKVFAVFSAAWVLPAMVGPLLAGLITQHLGWRWVFGAVIFLVIPATAALAPSLRTVSSGLASGTPPVPRSVVDSAVGATPAGTKDPAGRRLLWAGLAAIGVLCLDLSREVPQTSVALALAVAALAAVVVAVRPLLPPGTLRLQPGLPGTIATKGFTGAAFFGTEVYLPYLLTSQHGWSTTTAGLALTGGGVSWALASAAQGRMSTRWSDRACTTVGTGLVLLATAALLTVSLTGAPPWLYLVGWVVAGGGMGLTYPRINVIVLGLSTKDRQGFNSAALTMADGLGSAVALAITGVLGGLLVTPGLFSAIFALTTVLALAATLVARRCVPGATVTTG